MLPLRFNVLGLHREVTDSFMVDYYPCKYKEGADPVANESLQAEFAMEHYEWCSRWI